MLFALKKINGAIIVMFGATVIVSLLLSIIPGDIVQTIMGEQALEVDREQLKKELWLDRPIYEQYGLFVQNFFSGTLHSMKRRDQTVTNLIFSRYPRTLKLALGATLFSILFALPLGIIAAVKRKGIIDNLAMTISLIGVSMPSFWLGPLLILLFSIHLQWFPVSGDNGDLKSLLLPSLTLGMAMAAILSRITRSSMIEVLDEDYIRTARAKGLRESVVILKHALRNALIPIVTIIGIQFGVLLAGAIITERVFNWPGLGMLLIEAIGDRDIRVVQGCVLVISLSYVLVNLVTDLVYGLIDPRIRHN